MKLALYQPWIYLRGGLERSLLELVTRSRHRWTVFTGHYEPESTFEGFARVDVRRGRPTRVDRSIPSVLRSAVEVWRERLPLDADTDGLVVWCDGIGDLVTFRNHSRPVFNICSTPLRAAFDPVYERQALAQRGLLGRLAYHAFRNAFTWVDRLAWRHYRGVVATSSEVKSRIVAGGLHDGASGMVMAYPGVDWSPDVRAEYEPFVLLPGRIMWTKNIELGVRAFRAAGLSEPWRLVIAGFVDRKSGPYLEKLRSLATELGARVEFVASPSDAELRALYARAAFCLFTPENEDWGIVPLEAMAHAKAVVATARGGPRESVADGVAGYLVEPDDVAGWSEAIRRLATDPERMRDMGRAAHRHVSRFTWDAFVRAVDDALEGWIRQPGELEIPMPEDVAV